MLSIRQDTEQRNSERPLGLTYRTRVRRLSSHKGRGKAGGIYPLLFQISGVLFHACAWQGHFFISICCLPFHEGVIGSLVRTLSLGNEGRVLYGARDDFGYFRPDSLGQIEAVSLRQLLPEEIDDVKDVWEARYLNGKYFFQTYEYLFSFDQDLEITDGKMLSEGAVNIWKAPKRFMGLSVVRDTLYLWEQGSGLKYMIADSLQLVPGGGVITGSSVTRVLAFPDRTSGLLAAFPYSGVYELKNNVLVKIFDLGIPIQLVQSRYDPNLIFMGSEYALSGGSQDAG